MAPKPKTVGGGHATGLSNDFFDFLQRGLNTGSFGMGSRGSPGNDTMGIAGILNDLLKGGAGNIGGSLGEMISRQNTNNIADLRARYGAGGGMAYGTPGGQAEAGYRAQHGADSAVAIGGLQLDALKALFPLYAQAAQIGTPQAQTIMQQNPIAAGLGTIAPIASSVLPFLRKDPFSGSAGPEGVNGLTNGLQSIYDYQPNVVNR